MARVLAVGSAFAIGMLTAAQAPVAWQPVQFTSQNGLPQNSVIDLAMDTAGYLWLSTEGGLVLYDGDRFRTVELPQLHSSQQTRVRGLLPVRDGTLLVSNTVGDRYLLSDGKVVRSWSGHPDHDLVLGASGVLPFASLHERLTDRVDTLPGRHLFRQGLGYLVQSGEDGRWSIFCRNALLHYKGDSLLAVARCDMPLFNRFRINGSWYGVDTAGALRAVDPVSGVTRLVTDRSGAPPGPMEALRQGRVRQMADPDLAVLVHDRDLYLIRPGADGAELRFERTPVELPERCTINAVLWSPRHRVLFVGTDTKGLFVYREQALRTRVCDPLPEGMNQAYYALHALGPDSILAFSSGYRTLFTPTGCTNFADLHPPGLNYQLVHPLRNGHLLVARHDRVIELDPRTGVEKEWFHAPGDLITALYMAGDSLWIGNAKGIGVFRDGYYRRLYSTVGGTSAFAVIGRTVWAVTCAGVVRFAPDGHVDTLSNFHGACVRAIRAEGDLVLLGTYGSGAYVVANGRLMALPMDRQGFMVHVHAFARDRKGMLWMTTNRGLFRLSLEDLRAWVHDPTHHLYYAYYGIEDGIRNAEFNGGCSPPYLELGNGHLVFPSLEGIIEVDPLTLPDPVPAGQVRITDVLLDGTPLARTGEIELPYDHGELRVMLSIPYWGSRANVQLEYRIVGIHADWIPLGIGERDLRFARSSPGSYELQVRKLAPGLPQRPASLRFTVLSPIYRRPWFLALAGVATGILFLLLLRLNENRLRRRNEELEQAVRQRTQELQRANEQLQRSVETKQRLVSIISHDIVTPLRFIARVARSVVRGRANGDPGHDDGLQDIVASSDKLYANARNILSWIKHQEGHIELRPRHVAMSPLVEEVLDTVRELAAGQGVALVDRVPLDDVLRTDRDVLLIILQNIIANAVNYTPSGSVTVEGGMEGDRYVLRIKDTGRGITPKALAHVRDILQGQRGRRGVDHGDPEMQGLGYVIIGELTSLLGGTVEVEARPEGGTVVTVRLPVQAGNASVPEELG